MNEPTVDTKLLEVQGLMLTKNNYNTFLWRDCSVLREAVLSASLLF